MFDRTEILIGKDNLKKLNNSNILVVGVGGVGGYVCEFLVRAGIENLTIIDFDTVDITNKNRQIIALDSTLHSTKVDVLSDRLRDINKNLKLSVFDKKLDNNLLLSLNLRQYDYIVDAIDDVANKVLLIKKCYENNIPCISAMGAGNRFDIPNFIVSDIFKTSHDGLAKILRKRLRGENVLNHKVVYSKSLPVKIDGVIGSISYYPPACASVLTAYVVNELLNIKG